jgi:hypothetical protein
VLHEQLHGGILRNLQWLHLERVVSKIWMVWVEARKLTLNGDLQMITPVGSTKHVTHVVPARDISPSWGIRAWVAA